MERNCYGLRIQFEKKRSYMQMAEYAHSDVKKAVDDFLNRFYDYYLSLPSEERVEVFRKIKDYHKNGWHLTFIEPDEETLSFKNNLNTIKLSYETKDEKVEELELVADVMDSFFKSTLPGNTVDLVVFSVRDANFSKYNPKFLRFSALKDKTTQQIKFVSSAGQLFGDKKELSVTNENKNQAENE